VIGHKEVAPHPPPPSHTTHTPCLIRNDTRASVCARAHTHTNSHVHAHTPTLTHAQHTHIKTTQTHTHARTHTHTHAHAYTNTTTHARVRARTHKHTPTRPPPHTHAPPLAHTHMSRFIVAAAADPQLGRKAARQTARRKGFRRARAGRLLCVLCVLCVLRCACVGFDYAFAWLVGCFCVSLRARSFRRFFVCVSAASVVRSSSIVDSCVCVSAREFSSAVCFFFFACVGLSMFSSIGCLLLCARCACSCAYLRVAVLRPGQEGEAYGRPVEPQEARTH
jgi:hypothetical protein